MSAYLHALLRALAFLTRLPPASRAFTGEHELGTDAAAFPFAGLLIALPAAGLVLLLTAGGLSADVTALLAVAFTIGLTGALHEDGLADTADGLFGHHPPERALAIMKDSRVGVYGALALVLAVSGKILILAELIEHGSAIAVIALIAASTSSRAFMAHLWSSLPSADPTGLAARVGAPSRGIGRLCLTLGALALVVFGGIHAGNLGLMLPLALGLGVHLLFRRWLRARLGGVTGDTIGADQQLVEIAVLLGFALAL